MALIEVSGTQHQDADYSLQPEVIEALWRMEDHHFWHRARNRWILDALDANGVRPSAAILEVGCGSGAVSRVLAQAGYRVVGVDTAEPLVRKAHQRCPEATFVLGEVGRLPDAYRGPFDVVGFFDVLEHLDQPAELLADGLRWASPGALALVTVPALSSLWTVVDELSGHKRRYERDEIASLLVTAGLQDVAVYGVFSSTAFIQRMQRNRAATAVATPEDRIRVMSRALRVPPAPLNAALGLLTRCERLLGLRAAQHRSGASYLAVGHWPGPPARPLERCHRLSS